MFCIIIDEYYFTQILQSDACVEINTSAQTEQTTTVAAEINKTGIDKGVDSNEEHIESCTSDKCKNPVKLTIPGEANKDLLTNKGGNDAERCTIEENRDNVELKDPSDNNIQPETVPDSPRNKEGHKTDTGNIIQY